MAHLPLLFVAIALVASTRAILLSKKYSSMAKVAAKSSAQQKDYRLPGDVVPVSYNILLAPDLTDNFMFNGQLVINITVLKETNRIVLHAHKSLAIKSPRLFLRNSNIKTTEISLLPPVRNHTNDFLILRSSQLLVPADYVLNMEFDGKLNDDGLGFYKINYEDDDGTQRSVMQFVKHRENPISNFRDQHFYVL